MIIQKSFFHCSCLRYPQHWLCKTSCRVLKPFGLWSALSLSIKVTGITWANISSANSFFAKKHLIYSASSYLLLSQPFFLTLLQISLSLSQLSLPTPITNNFSSPLPPSCCPCLSFSFPLGSEFPVGLGSLISAVSSREGLDLQYYTSMCTFFLRHLKYMSSLS